MKKTFKTLYEKSTTGKIKYWTISVSGTKEEATITVKYGADEDKERISEKIITEGKNIGKSNETTSFEQAVSEAQSTWTKKKDSGYVEDQTDLDTEVLLPMLAHKWLERAHNIVFPCYVSAKLDGVRVLVQKVSKTEIKYFSRGGKPILTLEHLTPDLLKLMKVDEVWDGEIYDHTISFQTIVSYMKKVRPESATLAIWFFDKVNTTKDFVDRYKELQTSLSTNKNKLIKLVEVQEIKDPSEVKIWHDVYVRRGFEGCMIRNKLGKYKLKDRSSDLLKYKEFIEEDFDIVSGYSGTGVEQDCITFVCKTDEGKEFGVRPRGDFETRKKWLRELSSLIGVKLVVRFQEWSDPDENGHSVPRFPIGILPRNYE
ncbi:MAG: hypothetical protein ACP5N7_07345 [Candidatus Pacearchaeota archaeon]